ncbi:MAG: MFS transporter [Pseudolabrys sp.]|nr:MFS transporter [Pseudolabrys sp.]
MLGNFATGLCILAPAGMLTILADGLNVGIRETGLLVTFGAVILCFGSPIVAWLTTRVDRRTLLATSLGFMVVGQAASAVAPNYLTILLLRLAMVAGAAVFTPQAASTVALLVPEKERSGSIAFVFLGWSLAVAGGLPLITFVSGYLGWRGAFAAAAMTAFIPLVLLVFALPRALYGPPLSLHSFAVLAGNRKVVLLLLTTILSLSGHLVVFVYLAPLLQRLAGASHEVTGLMFALFGIAALIGNVIATRIVGGFGAWPTAGVFLASTLTGLLLWSLGAGYLPVMGLGIAFIGVGFAATNSMQQARLVQAAPDLASASVALNTSGVYVGQAIGSAVGGIMYGLDMLHGIGFVGLAFIAGALVVWAVTKDQRVT